MITLRNNKGAAMIEIITTLPLCLFMIIVTLELSQLFQSAIGSIRDADSAASAAIKAWETDHANAGLIRPCIEGISPQRISTQGRSVVIGIGELAKAITPESEVQIVSGDICEIH